MNIIIGTIIAGLIVFLIYLLIQIHLFQYSISVISEKIEEIEQKQAFLEQDLKILSASQNKFEREIEKIESLNQTIYEIVNIVKKHEAAILNIRSIYENISESYEFNEFLSRIYRDDAYDLTDIYNNIIFYEFRPYIKNVNDVFYNTDCKGFSTLIYLIGKKAIEEERGLIVRKDFYSFMKIYPERISMYCFHIDEYSGHCINRIYYKKWEEGWFPISSMSEQNVFVDNDGNIIERRCNEKCAFYFENYKLYDEIFFFEFAI